MKLSNIIFETEIPKHMLVPKHEILTIEEYIELVNNSSDVNAYFDDIRVSPFNSNLKSFVYDPETQRLMAELDENNYATFYHYDEEGNLFLVKKETVKGIIGKTHGVKIAANPAKNDAIKKPINEPLSLSFALF